MGYQSREFHNIKNTCPSIVSASQPWSRYILYILINNQKIKHQYWLMYSYFHGSVSSNIPKSSGFWKWKAVKSRCLLACISVFNISTHLNIRANINKKYTIAWSELKFCAFYIEDSTSTLLLYIQQKYVYIYNITLYHTVLSK